jgi:hypothetical protein
MMGLVLTELMTPVVSFSSPQRSLASPSSAMGHARGAKRPVPVHAGSPDVQWWLQAPSGWGDPPFIPGELWMPSCAGVTEEGCGRKALNSEPTEQQITAGKTAIAPLFFPVSARSKVRISAENRDPVHDKISGKTAHTANPPVPSEMSGATPRRAAVPSAIMTPKRQDCVLRTAGEPAVRATKQCEARLRERSV